MAINSAEEFFGVLEKSRLLEPEQLTNAQATVNGDDARRAARKLIDENLITRWQAKQLLAGRSSFFLGKYKLIQLLGRGGMGGVFLAEHVTMNRRVALKIIARHIRKDPASLERFLSEARAIATLDHQNIVQAYSVDNEGDRYYIVMEFIDGRDLKQMVEDDGPLAPELAANYIRQAADGLAHAHDRNMIHCDIKPSNLLVSKQGVVKILDMGLARLTDRSGNVEDSDEQRVLGSVDYLAPEQAVESPDLDYRADIYSLGCTLYYLLTGHAPFPEGSLPERILKHQTEDPEDIIQQRPDVPQELADICRDMMAKNPEDRPQSAEQISKRLSDIQAIAQAQKPSLPPKRKPAAAPAPRKQDSSENGMPVISVDLDETPSNSGGFPGIAIDTGDKPAAPAVKAGAAPAASAAKPAAAATAAEPAEVKPGFMSTTMGKVVVFGGAGLVLLIVAVLGTLAATGAFSSDKPKDPSVAKSGDQADSDEPGVGEPGVDEPGVDEPGEGEPPADKPPVDETPTDEPPVDEPPVDEPPVDEPPVDEPPVDEPPVDEPPVDEPPVTEPPTDEPPVDEPPVAPEKKDPMRGLAAAIDMSALEDDAAGKTTVEMGTIELEASSPWSIKLIGGKEAMGSRSTIVLRETSAGLDYNDWTISVETEGANASREDVANIHLNDNKSLQLTWLDGEGRKSAGFLENCALKFTVGGNDRYVPFGGPKKVAPLTIDLDSGKMDIKFPPRKLPSADKIKLQITEMPGFDKATTVDPGKILEPGKKTTTIVPAGTTKERLSFVLNFSVSGRSPRVSLSAMTGIFGRPQIFRKSTFGPKGFDGMLQQFETKEKQADAYIKQLEEQKKKFAKNKQAVQQIDQQIGLAQGQLTALQTNKTAIDQIKKIYESLNGKAGIEFRIYATVEDHEIVLYETSADAATE